MMQNRKPSNIEVDFLTIAILPSLLMSVKNKNGNIASDSASKMIIKIVHTDFLLFVRKCVKFPLQRNANISQCNVIRNNPILYVIIVINSEISYLFYD